MLGMDDLNDSLGPDCFLSEPVKDMLIFGDLDLPAAEASTGLALPGALEMDDGEADLNLEAEATAKLDDPVRLYLKEMGMVSSSPGKGRWRSPNASKRGKRKSFTPSWRCLWPSGRSCTW